MPVSIRTLPLSSLRPGRRPGSRPSTSVLLTALVLVLSQLLWPVTVSAASALAPELVPLSQSDLAAITGGCFSNCDGDSDSGDGGGGGGGRTPDEVGSPYWEYTSRTLISRVRPPGDLVWHKINSTYRDLGPFTVSYTHREAFNWSVGGGIPSGVVRANLGSSYDRTRTETASYTIPPRTAYKLFVAYPTERWRYYYSKYQDYDDNSRDKVGSGSATTNKQSTLTNVVDSPVY